MSLFMSVLKLMLMFIVHLWILSTDNFQDMDNDTNIDMDNWNGHVPVQQKTKSVWKH